MLPKKVPATVRQEVANTLAKAHFVEICLCPRQVRALSIIPFFLFWGIISQENLLYSRKRRIFATMEYLVAFFFRVAIIRMNDKLLQKESNSRHTFLFLLAKCSDRG